MEIQLQEDKQPDKTLLWYLYSVLSFTFGIWHGEKSLCMRIALVFTFVRSLFILYPRYDQKGMIKKKKIKKQTGMKAIIGNHDRIYGSIGLYIPLSLDSRDNIFRYLFSRTA